MGAPPGWPEGRIIVSGTQGVMYSDDGGATYTPSNYFGFGRNMHHIALIRRPDDHPLGPEPRLVALLDGGSSGPIVFTSDDAGATWRQGPQLVEPNDGGVGWRAAKGIHALPEPGEADPGAGGRALAALARGHFYETRDGGATWKVVGRAPDMNEASYLSSTEIGPDGRMYVGISGFGAPCWVWRTKVLFVVAESAPETVPPASVSVSVRPNPVRQRAEVAVTLAEAGTV